MNKVCITGFRAWRLAAKMDVYLGESGLDKSWQAAFPPEEPCRKCGKPSRIAFVAHEGAKTSDDDEYVTELHHNDPGGEGYWPHDAIAVAVYICRECMEPTAVLNQA
jgi:hypothetical protein